MLRNVTTSLAKLPLKHKIVLLIGSCAVIVPSILVALLASVYYYLGIEKLFSDKIAQSIQETVQVAKLYLNEHVNSVKVDTMKVARDLEDSFGALMTNPAALRELLDLEADKLGLSEIEIFTKDSIIARNSSSFSLLFDEPLSAPVLEATEKGQIYIEHQADSDKVRAIARLQFPELRFFPNDVYLLVGRYIDSDILQHLERTESSASTYLSTQDYLHSIRNQVVLAFIGLASSLLVLTVGIAKALSRLIVQPVNDLIDATSNIRLGEFHVKVKESRFFDEIALLAKAFNKMTERIETQHQALEGASRIIDERRRFIETILGELSAGVLVIDNRNAITLCNNSAAKILHFNHDTVIGQDCFTILPELKAILPGATQTVSKVLPADTDIGEHHLEIVRHGQRMHLLLRITDINSVSKIGDTTKSTLAVLVTFDDITEIVAGQRFKAWADVARRVAHEIKNPLTPIQLSVDRLQKIFQASIKENPDTLKYFNTISARVEDIRRMISEFVDFSRLSVPAMKAEDLISIIKEVIFLRPHEASGIHYQFDRDVEACYVWCDRMQIVQVLTNLINNAAESIRASQKKAGVITISVAHRDQEQRYVEIKISDNGFGIDEKIVNRIFEPYVTTKASGMGLGLWIVKKIIEEHKSKIKIMNLPEGACVSFTLPIATSQNEIVERPHS